MAPRQLPFRLLDPTTLANLPAVRTPSTTGRIIQGKQREANSRAARVWQKAQSVRLKRALVYITRGKDIFAYHNLRTNQVVYSFSRFLNNKDVLSQLIFHGKKTVPAALRKDMWIPHFSVHFDTKQLGLKAYEMLRELTIQRQLAPPAEMITNTEETLAKLRPKDPNYATEWDKRWRRRLGQFMIKTHRARVLMDQKATSVADLAYVLTKQESAISKSAKVAAMETAQERARLEMEARLIQEGKEVQPKEQTPEEERRERRRRLEQLKREGRTKAEVREILSKEAEAKALDKFNRGLVQELEKALSEEYGCPVRITDLPEARGYNVKRHRVLVQWKDPMDKERAESWPDFVYHGKLEETQEHFMGRCDSSHPFKKWEPLTSGEALPDGDTSIQPEVKDTAEPAKEEGEEDGKKKGVFSKLKSRFLS